MNESMPQPAQDEFAAAPATELPPLIDQVPNAVVDVEKARAMAYAMDPHETSVVENAHKLLSLVDSPAPANIDNNVDQINDRFAAIKKVTDKLREDRQAADKVGEDVANMYNYNQKLKEKSVALAKDALSGKQI
jgi:hypothetical protein